MTRFDRRRESGTLPSRDARSHEGGQATREAQEHAIDRGRCGRVRDLDEMLAGLPKDALIVFHCHHGGRSMAAAQEALQQGYSQVYNVAGGIDAWSAHVDPSVPRY